MRAARARRSLLCGHFAVAAALLYLALALTIPARAAAEGSQCEGERFLYELYAYAVGTTLTPESGTEVTQHSAVSFSGESETPLTFRIASSEAGLAHPDIDSGVGTTSQGASTTKYTFTSTKAAAAARTAYWDVSFTHKLANCGNEERTFSTSALGAPARTLIVVSASEIAPAPPAPEPPPAPGPAPGPVGSTNGKTTSWSAASPTGLRVGITSSTLIHIGHPAIAYLVDCTAACEGKTSFTAWQLRGKHKPRLIKLLGFGPRTVSMKGASGGNVRYTDHFRGRALKQLKQILRGGGTVKLQVSARVKDTQGNFVQAQRATLLR